MMLTDSLAVLGPIAKKIQKPLAVIGIKTIKDLLFYYPWRHEDLLARLKFIVDLEPKQMVSICATVEMITSGRSAVKRTMVTEARVRDKSGSIRVVWFNQPFIGKTIKPGEKYYFVGKTSIGRFGLELSNPIFEKVKTEQVHTARIVPIYNLTARVTQKQLRFLIYRSLNAIALVKDYLPAEFRRKYNLVDLRRAMQEIHFPTTMESFAKAKRRLSFDELFLIQIFNLKLRANLHALSAESVPFNKKVTDKFIAPLPFALTAGQKKAAFEIIQDLAKNHPMNRLLNGDVGSGKTVVAALAAVNVIESGGQVSLMCPTEILASQHFLTIARLCAHTSYTIALLVSGKAIIAVPSLDERREVKRRELLKLLKEGSIHFIVGTHALIEENVIFKRLALAIVDEQHRFGVEQRKMLKEKNKKYHPHLLSMTATPIPRTLALSLYGDLDISVLNEMPPGRIRPQTFVVKPGWRARAYERVKEEIGAGYQAFVVCPLIDPSDTLGVKSVTEEYKFLKEHIFQNYRIGLLHGKLKSKAKEAVMQDFAAGNYDILIATTVVEVGIDVPNATVMMIEGAERFGLSQLHQLRGRIGRSTHKSYCLVFPSRGIDASERLQIFEKTNDGFLLAEADLKLRGQGDIFGVRQSGEMELKIASLGDTKLLAEAHEAATELMAHQSGISPEMRDYLALTIKNVHLE